ncbi:MAG: class I SAM-dependent methyltransferase [Terracidiphilus sp.]
METGRASATALGVAIRRAAHQLMDHPPVLDDPLAVRLVGDRFPRQMERAMHRVARDFRAFVAVRSRYAEDQLAAAVAAGAGQYVILGAGLDTFAYRNPFPSLRVFEVDFPATQAGKRTMLGEAGIAEPPGLTFIALDLERRRLTEALTGAGFDAGQMAFFSWLGVVPFLTMDAFRATLGTITHLPAGTAVSFDYVLSPERFSPPRRAVFARIAQRAARFGEPFRIFFSPEQLEEELKRAGFRRFEQRNREQLNSLYFRQRADGLELSAAEAGMLATAWV